MTTVLVTGVAGRIGRNLAAALRDQGATVRGVVLPDDPGLERAQAAGIDCLVGNLRDPDVCAAAVVGVDAVVHLGAMLLFGNDDHNPTLFDDNLRATFNLLQAALVRKGELSRFVFASSDEVYPSLYAKYAPIDESHPKEPYSFYGLTKLTSEEFLRFFHRAHGLPIAIARFALTIEPWEVLEPSRPLGNFLHARSMLGVVRARAGEEAAAAIEARIPPGEEPLLLARDQGGTPYLFHYCDVRDLVQGLLLLLKRPAAIGEAFNLSGPAPFSYDQAVPYLAERTGRPIIDTRIPGPPIRIHHSTAKARGLLGYTPVHDIFSTIDTAIASRQNG
ncbi:MAG: UDP-glucose 4-epimerase [Thermomicrobiales bacterium]|nr:UDP-glucose 4-epimerase [Thermomicrobiales bacterium]